MRCKGKDDGGKTSKDAKTSKRVMSASEAAKKARAGTDMGKPGKQFAVIAEKAGGGEKGKRIAGAIFHKLRKKGRL
jgi:hypothetical protein